jgi:hypothetical protein
MGKAPTAQLRIRWDRAHAPPPPEIRSEVVRLLGRLLIGAANEVETTDEGVHDVGGEHEHEDHR